jgi:hypothetical protein
MNPHLTLEKWKWLFRKFTENSLYGLMYPQVGFLGFHIIQNAHCGAAPNLIAGLGINKIYDQGSFPVMYRLNTVTTIVITRRFKYSSARPVAYIKYFVLDHDMVMEYQIRLVVAGFESKTAHLGFNAGSDFSLDACI